MSPHTGGLPRWEKTGRARPATGEFITKLLAIAQGCCYARDTPLCDALPWMSVWCCRRTACCRALSSTVNIGKQTAAWYSQPGDGGSLGLAGIAGGQTGGVPPVSSRVSHSMFSGVGVSSAATTWRGLRLYETYRTPLSIHLSSSTKACLQPLCVYERCYKRRLYRRVHEPARAQTGTVHA